MRGNTGLLALLLLSLSVWQVAGAAPIPELVNDNGQYHLMVDDKPFLVLGGQSANSTSSSQAKTDTYFEGLKAMKANTAEMPIYWEMVEPTPGKYDFTVVDRIIEGARRADMKLVILWFASWKNGESHYTPEWVKRDTETYPRVIDSRGMETNILSPLSTASRDADARAFAAVMEHIKKVDSKDRTVIMMQVENEPGFLGTDRDYSAEAEALYTRDVPPDLVQHLSDGAPVLSDTMRAALSGTGAHSGNWEEVFGPLAAEAFSAYHIARYVDFVTRAGKAEYALPMYVNVWLVEPGEVRAGGWPSGGATEHVIDVWKHAAPSVDLIAPDIYFPKYHKYSEQFTRVDNPLFVPEANRSYPFFTAYALTTFTRYNGLGFAVFGTDKTHFAPQFIETYHILRSLLPLIIEKRYSGDVFDHVQGISLGEDMSHSIPLTDDVSALVTYPGEFDPLKGRAWGAIFKLSDEEYIVAGVNHKVAFKALTGPFRDIQVLSIDAGSFGEDGEWQHSYRRNGDERHVTLDGDHPILRVKIRHPE